MNTKCCGRFVCLESEAIVLFYTNVVICGIFQKLEMLGSTAALECLFDYQKGNVTAAIVFFLQSPFARRTYSEEQPQPLQMQ